eukprot:6206042-Pleurochrysis_carterae.AAC.2
MLHIAWLTKSPEGTLASRARGRRRTGSGSTTTHAWATTGWFGAQGRGEIAARRTLREHNCANPTLACTIVGMLIPARPPIVRAACKLATLAFAGLGDGSASCLEFSWLSPKHSIPCGR